MALRCSFRSWIEVSTSPCSSQKVRSCAREAEATAQPRGESKGGPSRLGRGWRGWEGWRGWRGWEGWWVERGHLGHARHAAVLVAYLAEHAALAQAGEPAEVDGSLGMPVAREHAPLARSQREHVPGTVEIARHRRRACQGAERGGAVSGRDPGRRALLRADNRRTGVRRRIQHGRERPRLSLARLRAALAGFGRAAAAHLHVHAHSKGGLLGVLVVDDHGRKLELIQPRALHLRRASRRHHEPLCWEVACGASAPPRKSLRRSTS